MNSLVKYRESFTNIYFFQQFVVSSLRGHGAKLALTLWLFLQLSETFLVGFRICGVAHESREARLTWNSLVGMWLIPVNPRLFFAVLPQCTALPWPGTRAPPVLALCAHVARGFALVVVALNLTWPFLIQNLLCLLLQQTSV